MFCGRFLENFFLTGGFASQNRGNLAAHTTKMTPMEMMMLPMPTRGGGGECLKSDVSILLAIACQDCECCGFVVYCYTFQHVVSFFLMVRFRLYWLSALMPSCRVY